MPALDPALGLTPAISQLQEQLPLSTTSVKPQSSSDGGGGSENLARAARSLESVQGGVAGQTMAVQQMSMATGQQFASLQMMINQLGVHIGTLSQSIRSAAMSTGASLAPLPYAAQHLYHQGRAGVSAMIPYAQKAYAGGRTGMGWASSVGAFGGAVGGAGMLPFMGVTTAPHAPGAMLPTMAREGLWGSFVHASGGGMLNPQAFRYGTASQLQELHREQFQDRLGDVGLGIGGALGKVAPTFPLDYAGFLGAKHIFGIGARGGLAGTLGAGLLGSAMMMPLTLPIGAAADEIMGQTSQIRGIGRQYARNAFRFMPTSGMGMAASRRPDMAQRTAFGSQMNRMEIEDLMYGQKDIQEIFAGMTNQDLMRGLNSSEEVSRRMREGKEMIKLIGRNMGMTIREATSMMGEMQAVGMNPLGAQGRAFAFGASSIQGLTPQEAQRRALAMAAPFTQQGYGAQMAQTGLMSQQISASAIQRKALSEVDVAALGGPEGAGEAIKNLVGGFVQTGVGRAMLVAGPGAGNINMLMSQAAARSSRDVNRLVDIHLGGERQIQELLDNPTQALGQISALVLDHAKRLMAGSPGLKQDQAVRVALETYMPGTTGAQKTAVSKLIMESDKGLQESMRMSMFRMTDDIRTQVSEERGPIARAKRWWGRMFEPASAALAGGMAGVGASWSRGTESISNWAMKTENMYMGREVDLESLAALGKRSRPTITRQEQITAGMDEDERRAIELRNFQRRVMGQETVDPAIRARANRDVGNSFADSANSAVVDRLVSTIKTSTSPQDRRESYEKLRSVLSRGRAGESPEYTRAVDEEIEKRTGVSADTSILAQDISPAYDKERNTALRKRWAKVLGLESITEVDEYLRPEARDYLEAYGKWAAGDETVDFAGIKEKAREALGDRFGRLEKIVETGGARPGATGAPSREDMGFFGRFVPTEAAEDADFLASPTERRKSLSMSDEDIKSLAREATSTRIAGVQGKYVSGLIGQLGDKAGALRGLRPRLERPEDVVPAIGSFLKTMTDDQTRALREKGGDRVANLRDSLRKIMADDTVSEFEVKDLVRLSGKTMNQQQAQELANMVNKEADSTSKMGMLGAKLLDAPTKNALTLSGSRGQLTDSAAKQVGEFFTQTMVMTDQVKELAAIIKEMKASR